jgi:hypothetical protein
MSNKSSPHGGFISEGTVIHGTMHIDHLLSAFADELNRVFPFNGNSLANDARRAIDLQEDAETKSEILTDMFDQLDSIAQREGFYFGAHPGDGSDFGYWTPEDDQEEDSRFETVTGTAPSYWACYFINDDSGDMSDEEIAQADAFAAWLGGNIVSCEETGFMTWHDARQFGALASDCETYTALIEKQVSDE